MLYLLKGGMYTQVTREKPPNLLIWASGGTVISLFKAEKAISK